MARFSVSGLSLAFDDIVPAAPGSDVIVLAHGFATSRAENWRRLSWYGAFERKGYRVLALDLRGHGESDKPHDAGAYAREAMAADILAMMDHAGVGHATLMGYSLGAQLAALAALAAPSRFDNLILGGVGGRLLAPPPAPSGMTLAGAMRVEDPATITEPILKGFRLFADQQGEDRAALAACSEGAPSSLTAERLAALAMPVLIAAGARDEIAGDPQVLAAAISGAKSAAIPACDHFSAIPHALFKAAVFDFLDGWMDE
jgi:pimeloyl-ACP methyl ester carboxylesterase